MLLDLEFEFSDFLDNDSDFGFLMEEESEGE